MHQNWRLVCCKIWYNNSSQLANNIQTTHRCYVKYWCFTWKMQMIFIHVEQYHEDSWSAQAAVAAEIAFYTLSWLKWHIFNAYFRKFQEQLLWHSYTHTHTHIFKNIYALQERNFCTQLTHVVSAKFDLKRYKIIAHMQRMDRPGYSHLATSKWMHENICDARFASTNAS